MTKGFTVGAVGAGAASLKIATDFEAGMSEVAAISGATGGDLQMLEDKAREMGKGTSFSATEAAEGLKYMSLAGWDAQESAESLEGVLHLAEAGALDLGRASDLTTDSMAALGLGVDDLDGYLDKVAQTSRKSNTDIDALMEAMVVAGGTFERFNVPLEESNAFLGVLANRGFKGSEAGTALNAIMARLTQTTGPAATALEDMGISAYDSEGNFRGMEVVMKEVESAMGDMTDAEKAHATTQLAGLNHGKTFTAMLNGLGDEYDELKDDIVNSDGALKDMRDTMKDNLQGELESMKSAISEAGIVIGNALIPMIKDAVAWINDWVDRFNELDSSTQQTILKVVGLVAALGPMLIIGGKIATGISSLIGLFGTVSSAIAVTTGSATASTTAVAGLAKVFTFMSGPGGIAVAAIAGITAAGIGLYNHLKKDAIPEVNLFGDEVSDSTAQAVGAFVDMTEEANVQLKELSWGQQEVTAEMAADMQEKQGQITNTLLSAIDERNEEEKTMMLDQFAQTSALTETEKEKVLEKMNENFDKEREVTEKGHERINQIIANAEAEGREIRQDEADEILYIRESMNIQVAEMMSQSEIEQKAILEQMRVNSGTITALEAAEVVQNATEKKDGVIQEANDQYDETVAWAIQQRDEHGTLTAEEAARVIKEAEYQRDESVTAAEEMHDDVVAEAQAQAGEHVDEVDWETGEVLSKWEVFKGSVSTKWSEISSDASTKWSEMTSSISGYADTISTYPARKGEELRSALSTKWGEIRTNASTSWSNIKSAITDPIDEAKTTISGIVDDIKGFFTNMKLKIPKIEMPSLPSFSMSGGFGFKPPSVPKIGVNWNAEGGIFDDPTIFNTANAGLQGVGEAGAEAILPLNKKTLGGIGEGIASTMSSGRSGGGNITQNITINSPEATSPRENARLMKNASRRLAMEWGG